MDRRVVAKQPAKRPALRVVAASRSPYLGGKDAKVTIIEFSDFECSFCSQAASLGKDLKAAYGNKIRFVFRHMPLDFHKKAHLASQASLAAHAQGKFWEYHDLLFANQEKLDKADLIKYAKQLKLDVNKFKKALDSGTYKAAVDADIALAAKHNVQGTPTFLINGNKVEGAQPLDRFKQIIDALLAGKPFPAEKKAEPQAAAPKPSKPVKINLGNSPSFGPKDAKVTIVEFSDFECPYCSQMAGVIKEIKDKLGKRVRLVFKHMPLSFHKKAHLASQASEAARAQGKFWEYHDLLFANQEKLDKADLIKYAKQLKLDVNKFKKALDTGKYKAAVDADLKEAQRLNVGGTPTFYVNGYQLPGGAAFEVFKKVIERAEQGLHPVPPQPRPEPTPQAAAPKPSKPVKINLGNSPSFGPKDAKVTIVEFSDFECPYCSQMAGVIKQIKDKLGKEVKFVFKHMPLSFHKKAHLASQASEAARAQGKFWEYHDLLFANQEKLDKADLIKYAKQLKLDVNKFKKALDTGKYKAAVDADLKEAQRLNVGGTPTFFVNGYQLPGGAAFEVFQVVINRAKQGLHPVPPQPRQDPPPQAAAPKRSKKVKINLGNSPSFGPKDAKVTIVEFSDFECPYCSQMKPVIKQIREKLGKEVKFVFKHMPLSFHKKAHLASQASEAARAQGKFWEYHDLLFANQEKLDKADLIKYAKQLKLDVNKFKKALDTGKYKAAVDADLKEAQRLNVGGTPTFFVNGYQLPGGAAFEVFQVVINRAKQGLHPVPPQPGQDPEPQAAAPKKPKGPVKIDLSNVASFGPKDAKVTVVEFSDFECPFCSRGAALLSKLKKALGHKVRFVFKHLPLSFHKKAHLAAQASEAARAQGKFWEYHDLLFANQEKLDKADLIKYAKQLKLDVKKFKKALDTGKYKAAVDASLAEAERIRVGGTPTFYVNGVELSSTPDFPEFKQMLEAKLKAAEKPAPRKAAPKKAAPARAVPRPRAR